MSHWHRLRRFELSERDYPGASCFVPAWHHVHCPNPAWDWDLYMGLVNSREDFDISLPPAI